MGVVLSRFSHLASTGKQSDPTLRLVMIPRCRKTRWLERVGHGPACAHGDTACFRILTESGIMLWRHRLLNTIASKFLKESRACNLRSETWRRWLSACLRTHLMCAPSPGCLNISSSGTLSAHSAVILTASDIFSLLCVVPYGMMNKSLSKVSLRYSLASPVVAHPWT